MNSGESGSGAGSSERGDGGEPQFSEKRRAEIKEKFRRFVEEQRKAVESQPVPGAREKDIVVINLSDSDDEGEVTRSIPVPASVKKTARMKSGGVAGPRASTSTSSSDRQTAELLYKMTEDMRQQFASERAKDKEEIQNVRELNRMLTLKVERVTLEKEGVRRELEKERAAMKALQEQLKVAGEELHQVNVILRALELGEIGSFSFGDSRPQGASQAAHGDSEEQIAREEYTLTAIKLEPEENTAYFVGENQDRERYEESPAEEFTPAPPTFANVQDEFSDSEDDNYSVPVVLARVSVEPPPAPPAYFFNKVIRSQSHPSQRRKTSKLLRKYKKARRVNAKPKPISKPNKVRRYNRPREKCPTVSLSQDVHSLVYGSKRDRTLFGLRSSAAPTKKFQVPGPKVRKKRQHPSSSSHDEENDIKVGTVFVPQTRQLNHEQEVATGTASSTHAVDQSKAEFGSYCCCGLLFGSKYLLKQHITYYGDWKFKCEDCGKPFYSTHYLRKHLIADHGKTLPEGVFGCTKCGGIFPSQKDLGRHQKSKECPAYTQCNNEPLSRPITS